MKRESEIHKMIRREHDRLSREIDKIQGKIQRLPIGAVKVLKGKYVYLSYRKEGKAVSEYIGTLEASKKIMEKIDQRKYYESVLKDLRADIKEVEAYLKTGEKFYGKSRKQEAEMPEYEDEREY